MRNLGVLRDELSRAGKKQDVPVDEWFDRTELARGAFEPDTWADLDIRTGAKRELPVHSNRTAFEAFAAFRFLHERSRVQERADHYLDL